MNEAQKQILNVIYNWIRTEKTPITLKEITAKLPNIKPRTVRTSAEALCVKGYLRRGMNIKNNSCYILIRTSTHEED